MKGRDGQKSRSVTSRRTGVPKRFMYSQGSPGTAEDDAGSRRNLVEAPGLLVDCRVNARIAADHPYLWRMWRS
jgi:hypothetical protein